MDQEQLGMENGMDVEIPYDQCSISNLHLSQDERKAKWEQSQFQFNQLDYSTYEKTSLEHMKNVYKQPSIANCVEKIEQEDNILRISTINPENIPKCNIQIIDLSFLHAEWQAHAYDEQFTMFIPNGEEEKNLPIIDKRWCKDVQIMYEERNEEGVLLDKYRVTKQVRKIKLQGDISERWLMCLGKMRCGEIRWFRLGPKYNLNPSCEWLILKIEILNTKPLPLVLAELSTEHQALFKKGEQPLTIYDDWNYLVERSEAFNERGKEIFAQNNNYLEAEIPFKKSYSLWRGMTKTLRKSLSNDNLKLYEERLNQYGGNYAQTLLSQKKYQECLDFYTQNKLKSQKNVYKLAKCLYELRFFEKAIKTLDEYKSEEIGEQKDVQTISPEFQKLKQMCTFQMNQLQKSSIQNFYRKLFI